ncbi:GNAT family N-acetyltransferase [Rhodococcus oryzae]|uniref:GNAT family N-acetyltransferase n=1 Tax=Rhodococcus oryzae TaxID=2571143 RepID=A0ABY2RK52_9NOCA|nr:GNAT family N-acetyltransferase [Rhodococcus oryzae]
MELSIRPLVADDLDRAASVLGEAFADYPWTTWCVQADSHEQRVAELQRLYLEHMAVPHGLAYIDADRNGVVAFIPPDVSPPDESVLASIAELHGDRFVRMMDAEEQMSAMGSWDDAWLLATIGVARGAQGRGLGGDLLAAGLAEMDRAGHAVWLDTATRRNLPLYERHGFSIAGHITIDDGPEVWRMFRGPRG